MKVTFPWPDAALSPNSRGHWSKRHKAAKALRRDSYLVAKAAKMSVCWDGEIHVWLDFYKPSKRRMDIDNLLSRCKAMLDGIADALGVDDSRFVPHPRIAPDTGGYVSISITPTIRVCDGSISTPLEEAA